MARRQARAGLGVTSPGLSRGLRLGPGGRGTARPGGPGACATPGPLAATVTVTATEWAATAAAAAPPGHESLVLSSSSSSFRHGHQAGTVRLDHRRTWIHRDSATV